MNVSSLAARSGTKLNSFAAARRKSAITGMSGLRVDSSSSSGDRIDVRSAWLGGCVRT